ncbi:uncharacterized protein LOC143175156 isoform X2 [Nomia melanderi]|uniref:uncharacterized protein LOC143175156 isoform X2 n=1 Tax=Nomia melanderi TaxID=2448451 RepID=UPI003FCDF9C8
MGTSSIRRNEEELVTSTMEAENTRLFEERLCDGRQGSRTGRRDKELTNGARVPQEFGSAYDYSGRMWSKAEIPRFV